MSTRTRVLVLHNIMAPYRFPLFRALANEPGIDLTVWFMSRSARNRRWSQASSNDLGFTYAVLPGVELNYFTRDLFTYIFSYSFPLSYLRQPCDVLISAGWLDFGAQAGLALSKMLKRKFILWSESTSYEPSWRRSVAKPLVTAMVQHSDAYVGVGSRSGQYLRMLGARDSDMFTAYSTVDVAHFQHVSSAARVDRVERKRRLGIRRTHVILYCGQFIERKGLRTLMAAFAAVKRHYEDVALVLVGYGPLQAELERAVVAGNLDDVHFLGHVEVEEMPRLYALADIFVLPSYEETWGLVVNEAMACGLPVIVSDRVGSAPDLVDERKNGYIVPVGDAQLLAERCLNLLLDDGSRQAFSAYSMRKIQTFTPEHAAQEFATAVRHVMRTS